MATNVFRARLEAELQSLVRRSIGLRGLLKSGLAGTGTTHDQLAEAHRLRAELDRVEFEKSRLRHELGLREPVGAVKLDAPAVAAKATSRGAVKVAPTPVRRTVPAAGGVWTRMIGGPGCR